MVSLVTSATAPGYDEPGQHLADYGELFARLVERMTRLKARAGRGAAVIAEPDRARLVAGDPDLAALDREIATHSQQIAARAAYARRLGVPLPLEILRERFALAPVDLEILGALGTIERGTAFNPYTGSHDQTMQCDVGFVVALLSNGDTMQPGDVRLRFSPDAPLVEGGLVEIAAASGYAIDPPLVQKRIRLADRVLDFIEGADAPPPSLLGAIATFVAEPMPANDVLLPEPALIDQVARALARSDQVVELIGAPGVGRKAIAGAAARELGRPLLVIDLAEIPVEVRALEAALRPLIREARLQGAVLAIDRANEYADGENQQWIFPAPDRAVAPRSCAARDRGREVAGVVVARGPRRDALRRPVPDRRDPAPAVGASLAARAHARARHLARGAGQALCRDRRGDPRGVRRAGPARRGAAARRHCDRGADRLRRAHAARTPACRARHARAHHARVGRRRSYPTRCSRRYSSS